ncbi:hypothetical protein AMTRI_Chr13g117220 [Amborella trichopoda]
MQSAHGPSVSTLMLLLHFQTALLHLNPLPNIICQTLSPFFIRPLASIVILDASTCSGDNCKFYSSSSITAFPPACMQKCSKAEICRPFLGRPPPGKHSGRLHHQHHGGCAQHAPNGTLHGGSRCHGSRAGGWHPPSRRDILGGAWTAGCRSTSLGRLSLCSPPLHTHLHAPE